MSMTFYDNWATNNFDRIAKLAEVGVENKDFHKRYAFILQEETEKLVNDQQEKIQSLEQEVARLKEENLKLRNCHNCKFPFFDYGEMDCRKKDNSFYDKYDLLYCDKWEIEK